MKYNFDEVIDRRNTDCIRFELCEKFFGRADVLPLWIADMDFRTPDFIFEAICRRNEHPILGYTVMPQNYFSVIKNWQKQQHQWDIKEEWLGFSAGIVPGLSFCVQVYSNVGDEVIIQPPVYPPFLNVVCKNDRKLIFNPLKEVNGRFEMDFEDLENKITDKTKMLILCNPHNPGGRTWEIENLKKLAEICAKHNIIVVADEIHADMALPGYKHIPFAKSCEIAENISVTFIAPTKAFNMPGLQSSSYVIPNPDIKCKLDTFIDKCELIGGNIFAYMATIAAYEKGNEWRMQMLDYVNENIKFVKDYFEKNIPQIKPMHPEASFLVWLNCEDLGIAPEDLTDFVVHKAGLALNDGRTFGPGGENHLRLNVACPRSVLKIALEKLEKAVKSI